LHFFSGRDDIIQKSVDPHHLMTSPPKKFKSKSSRFFKIETRRVCFFRGIKQLSSSIGWKVMTEQIPSHYSGFAVLKGCDANITKVRWAQKADTIERRAWSNNRRFDKSPENITSAAECHSKNHLPPKLRLSGLKASEDRKKYLKIGQTGIVKSM